MSKAVLNECPRCQTSIVGDFSNLPTLESGGCTVVICNACGHAFAANQHPEGIQGGSFDYDWLHLHYDSDNRKVIKEVQEKVFQDLGQWG